MWNPFRSRRAAQIEPVTLSNLRSEVDLAMLMAERLSARGDVGSASKLINEVQSTITETFATEPRSSRRTAVLAGVGAAVVLSAGSAAAFLGTAAPSAGDAEADSRPSAAVNTVAGAGPSTETSRPLIIPGAEGVTGDAFSPSSSASETAGPTEPKPGKTVVEKVVEGISDGTNIGRVDDDAGWSAAEPGTRSR